MTTFTLIVTVVLMDGAVITSTIPGFNTRAACMAVEKRVLNLQELGVPYRYRGYECIEVK